MADRLSKELNRRLSQAFNYIDQGMHEGAGDGEADPQSTLNIDKVNGLISRIESLLLDLSMAVDMDDQLANEVDKIRDVVEALSEKVMGEDQ